MGAFLAAKNAHKLFQIREKNSNTTIESNTKDKNPIFGTQTSTNK